MTKTEQAMVDILDRVHYLDSDLCELGIKLNKYRSVATGYDQFTRDVEHFMSITRLCHGYLLRRHRDKYRKLTQDRGI